MQRLILCAVVAVTCGMVEPVSGAPCYYIGPDQGSWHVAENWSCEAIPARDSNVRVFNDLTVRIDEDVPDLLLHGLAELQVGYFHSGGVLQENGTVHVDNLTLGRWDGMAFDFFQECYARSNCV